MTAELPDVNAASAAGIDMPERTSPRSELHGDFSFRNEFNNNEFNNNEFNNKKDRLMKFHPTLLGLFLLVALTLNACGGGGGGSSNPPANQSPPGETVINGKA